MSEVLTERTDAGVALLRLNRPDTRNALTVEMRGALADAVNGLVADDSVRAIVVAGSEKVFAAGADLAELSQRTLADIQSPQAFAAAQAFDSCRKPIIAAVNGAALGGGCELALRCDMVIAGEGASFGFPEVRFGMLPGAGGAQRFVRAAGRHRASRYLMTGQAIPAPLAFELGLVSEVVADGEVLRHALNLAARVAALPPLAIEAIKEVVRLGPDAPLEVALALERKAFQLLFITEDRREGVAAYLEKRSPQFKGR